LAPLLGSVAARHLPRLPDRRAAGRRRRDPTFLSYTVEKRLTKHPEEFGHGAIEGVAGPEAANNASAAGTLMPLLTLGLPTSATAAIMLAGFQQYGLNPGPLLFAERPDLVWGLIASLFVANVMLVVLNLPLVGLWVRLLAIPQPWLYAGILVFAAMGTVAAKPSVVELSMLALFGALGFLMRRFDYPIAPMVVGLILGPMAETQLRRALSISLGDPLVILESPIAAGFSQWRAGSYRPLRHARPRPLQGKRRLRTGTRGTHKEGDGDTARRSTTMSFANRTSQLRGMGVCVVPRHASRDKRALSPDDKESGLWPIPMRLELRSLSWTTKPSCACTRPKPWTTRPTRSTRLATVRKP
jgi:hypothetical protein